jgi:ABC-type uncharacterized transport system YnjBCD permease subunit
MEPIALCGLVIVVFGLWVEFERALKAVVKMIRTSGLFKSDGKHMAVQQPVSMSRMPICLANLPSYRQGI